MKHSLSPAKATCTQQGAKEVWIGPALPKTSRLFCDITRTLLPVALLRPCLQVLWSCSSQPSRAEQSRAEQSRAVANQTGPGTGTEWRIATRQSNLPWHLGCDIHNSIYPSRISALLGIQKWGDGGREGAKAGTIGRDAPDGHVLLDRIPTQK